MKNAYLAFAMLILTAGVATAGNNPTNWENLGRLTVGQRVEITRRVGESARGTFVRFSEQSVDIRDDQHEVTIPRSQVLRVRLDSKTNHHAMWLGLALGAGAGAGIGAGIGGGIGNESGGDFRNLAPAITGAVAAVGALAGLGIGYAIDHRHQTIYQAK